MDIAFERGCRGGFALSSAIFAARQTNGRPRIRLSVVSSLASRQAKLSSGRSQLPHSHPTENLPPTRDLQRPWRRTKHHSYLIDSLAKEQLY